MIIPSANQLIIFRIAARNQILTQTLELVKKVFTQGIHAADELFLFISNLDQDRYGLIQLQGRAYLRIFAGAYDISRI